MTYQPELLVTAGSTEEVARLLEAGANAVLVGEEKYGVRLPGKMTLDRIEASLLHTRTREAKLYVAVNNIFHNDRLQELADYLRCLEQLKVDAIVFGDPAVLMTARSAAPSLKLHWNAEMTSTNYKTAKFWQKRGASRIGVARELNMEQVLEMKQQLPDMDVEIQVHGMTNIYHSKRYLVNHYFAHLGERDELGRADLSRKLFLIEQERREEKYPIFEDANGTHIMSSDDICVLEDLKPLLDARVDCFKIEGLLKPVSYNETVVKVYREAIDTYLRDPDQYRFKEEWMDRIRAIQDPERELSFGFFYKDQVY
ncbi:peptidase U32 family protein [Paenibacillus popilliae]|uniref:Collagenase n=1 Tax=Paenibacillus popilliae ATCC 14706 TaxID=1212764 RepID=M9M6Y0_PAEPP|nr:peptidase U32 family protein [Paenibacillus popilliae]GAC43383.1 collagenase [Paenibacillus popilliae ATCC 14706]